MAQYHWFVKPSRLQSILAPEPLLFRVCLRCLANQETNFMILLAMACKGGVNATLVNSNNKNNCMILVLGTAC